MKKILLIAALIIAGVFCTSMEETYTVRYEKYHVRAGQTMWEIAETYMPQQSKIKDIREMCFVIKNYNGLKNSAVYAGQELTIPLYERK